MTRFDNIKKLNEDKDLENSDTERGMSVVGTCLWFLTSRAASGFLSIMMSHSRLSCIFFAASAAIWNALLPSSS